MCSLVTLYTVSTAYYISLFTGSKTSCNTLYPITPNMLSSQPIKRQNQNRDLQAFSHAWHWLHVFPRLALVARVPALGTGCMPGFASSSHWLIAFWCVFTLYHKWDYLRSDLNKLLYDDNFTIITFFLRVTY